MKTSDFLAPTQKLFQALEVFQVSSASLQPGKEHVGAHVKLLDFEFNKKHFVDQMLASIVDWVFSKKEAKRIFDEEYGPDQDLSAAVAALYNAAKETFRSEAPQGQFGELLLSGFLQHLFKAAPLLRKQKVRTSDSHERFGADAIHFCNAHGNRLYLGESKCYKSLYQFPNAFSTSLESMTTTLANFASEIKKFNSGNFIEEEMRPIASSILRNQISDLEIHPVAIIIYNETRKLTASTSREIKEEIREAVSYQCKKLKASLYNNIPTTALSRYTYIIMPVWELDALLDEFVGAL
jgi:hypothetical protein